MKKMVQDMCAKRDRGERLLPIERIVLTVAHETQDRIPVGFLFTEWVVNRYGYTCSEAAADPEKHSDAIVKFFDEFDYDTLFPGIETTVVEAEILGCKLKRPVDSNPQIVEHAIKSEADVERLEELVTADNLLERGRMPVRLELFRQLLKKTEGRYAIIATPMQPFPVAVQLLGVRLMSRWLMTRPLLVHRVVEACTQACIRFANAFKDVGTHGITSIAAWNSVPYFSPEQLWEFDTPYLARMIQSVAPLPFIHYYWGLRLLGDQWERFLVHQMATGTFLMTNLAPDADEGPSQDLKRFRELAQSYHKSYVVGMDAALMSDGTPEAIRNRVREYIGKLYPCDKGCMVVPNAIPADSPVENVRAFIDAINEFGTFPLDKARLGVN
ncbi:MAG TPA: uroporphyrinogen-III decarboxylase [Chloroflexi bacterium]|nr:uroporphyrinogen-III decarboxylase [Chloroflexota bacterium]